MRKTPAKHRQWILRELPLLEEYGLLDTPARKRLEDHYNSQPTTQSNWIVIAFAILGALLIGGGIILLFAHNWEELSRSTRAVLSFCPLAVGIGFGWIALKRNGTSLQESAALFQTLAVGASIALIGQTYHIPSNTPAFLLTWALLIMPLIFLLKSVGSYVFYLALITCWAGAAQDRYDQAIGLWALLLPALFWIVNCCRVSWHSPRTLLSLWALMLCLPIALGITMEHEVPGLWIVVYASFFSLIGLLGLRYLPESQGWSNPLGSAGILGITGLTYLFTWYELWGKVHWSYRHWAQVSNWELWHDAFVALLLLIPWAITAVKTFDRHSLPNLILASFPPLAVIAFATSLTRDFELINTLIFNLYMLTLGLAYLVQGCRTIRLRLVNFGMAVLSLLLVSRFFDSDFGFLARGIAFILIGCGFLIANLLIARQKHKLEAHQS